MALAERHRTVIYQHFAEQLGEETAEAMMSQFPVSDLDVPATKEFVRAEIAEVRTELAELRGEMRTEMADLGNQVTRRLQVTIGIVATVVAVVQSVVIIFAG